MVVCPECGNEIPTRKLIFLTNFNTVTCPTCLTKLQANKKIGSLIGGIGGGIGGGLGGLLIIFWFDTKEMIYLMLLIAVFPILFLASLLASIKFMKFEVKS